jgi:hypothetical protein
MPKLHRFSSGEGLALWSSGVIEVWCPRRSQYDAASGAKALVHLLHSLTVAGSCAPTQRHLGAEGNQLRLINAWTSRPSFIQRDQWGIEDVVSSHLAYKSMIFVHVSLIKSPLLSSSILPYPPASQCKIQNAPRDSISLNSLFPWLTVQTWPR